MSSFRDLFRSKFLHYDNIKLRLENFQWGGIRWARKSLNAAIIENNKEEDEPSGSGPAEAFYENQGEKLWNDDILGTDSKKTS